MNTPLLLKRTEVAALLGVSPSSVDRLERAGVLPHRRQLGGAARWLRAEVEAALAALPAGANTARTQAARAARRAA
jgi:predicted DNA-binding transcriptional regulator AlpA